MEYEYPWGWGELEGIAKRSDYDLTQHAEFSGEDLSYFDQENDRRYLPHVVEPAAGADRATLAFLLAAYTEEEVRGEQRTVLRLHTDLAPNKVAVLPLSKKEELRPIAREVADIVRPHLQLDYDEAGSIGKRYRRQDEVGTPLCVTVDFDTLDDRAVTVRDRDSMNQDRIPIEGLLGYLPRTPRRLSPPMEEPKPSVDPSTFFDLDLRVGRVVAVEDFPEAHRPAYRVTVDFGDDLGRLATSAQVTNYEQDELLGRLVVGVCNIGTRRVAGFESRFLILGAVQADGEVRLLTPDADVDPGTPVA